MADNVSVSNNSGNPGVDYNVASDEVAVGGTQPVAEVQFVKLVDGTLNGTAVIPGGSAGLKVDLSGTAANATAVKVDGSAVTQPVSGTVTSNIGTTNGLALDATLTGGTTKAIARGGAKGTSTAADVTSTASGANHQGMDSILYDGSGNLFGSSGTPIRVDPTGTTTQPASLASLPALATGSNLAGRFNPEPQAANGLSIGKLISAATTNATNLKASGGNVYTIIATNTNAAVRFLKLYNKASAPTVGTDTPVMTLPIPGNTAAAGFTLDTGGMGIAFGTGIGYATTTGVADSDTGAVAANEVVATILYK